MTNRIISTVIILALPILFAAAPALADESVNGYFRQNGTYVQPHMRFSPDGDRSNNWSTQGNVNPYTGAVGTHSPYGSPSPSFGTPAPSFGSPSPAYNPYGIR